MGVTLQSILGVFLILEICSTTGNNPIHQNVSLDKIDTNINLIEKLPKTDAELNIATKDTQKNINHDTQLYPKFVHRDENDTNSQSISHNEVEKENKDNSIRQDSIEKNRENDSRSINIQKYLSPEFQNNVYTLPITADVEKHIDDLSYQKSSTRKYSDFANIELSTPKMEFFDKKFNEAKQKLEQEYEFNGFDDYHHDNDHHDSHAEDFNDDMDDENGDNLHLHHLFGEPHTSLDYKEQTNISKNNTINRNSKHDDLIVEQMKKINFVSSYAETSTYKYDFKEDLQHPETSSSKIPIHTTGKSTTLTKPPANNNSHILSNKIESETIKAIRPFPESSTKSFADENELIPKEQTVEENQIHKVNITAPEVTTAKEILTTPIIITRRDDKVTQDAVPEVTTVESILTTAGHSEKNSNFESTSLSNEFVSKNEGETTSADTETTTISETPTTSSAEETTHSEESITPIDPFKTTEESTTVDVTSSGEDTTTDHETTSGKLETTEEGTTVGLQAQTTESVISQTEITTKVETENTSDHTTAGSSTEQSIYSPTTQSTEDQTTPTEEVTTSTDEPETTESGVRVSKEVVFTESTSETIETTSEVSTVTEIIETTSYIPETSTITEKPSTIVPTIINTSVSTVGVTTAESTTTTVEFIHVETRDNHTTLLPETLNPNFSYSTPFYNRSRSINVTESSEQTTLDTTPSGDEVTETSASTEHATIDNPEDSKGKIAAIVISTVGAVCLVLLAGLLYLMRKRQKRFNYKQRCRPVNLDDYSVDNLSVYNSVRRKADRQSKRSYGNPAFDDPVAVTHPLNFPALAKFAANTEDIKAEFEEIPQITAKTSELPEGCEPKNRYANVIPLPETRVFLKTIDGYPNSDYINANYVTGPKNTKGYYIACQAPLQDTVDDFWRMIWEQQSKVILMITHFFENGMEKCFDYLPPSEVLDCNRLFGDFQVTLKKRDVKDKYIISSLQLKNMVSNSWREVTHFWYLGWPEKGVPSEGNSLIAFLIEARSFMKSSTLDKTVVINGNMNGSTVNEVNPVVVHCSPGTGRTGVVIACDIAIREFEQTRLVDIPKIVYRVRRDRASAVQTKEQYMFIYKVVSLYATKLSGGGFESF